MQKHGNNIPKPKDKLLEMQTQRIHEILCSRDKSYIEQTERAAELRTEEHQQDVIHNPIGCSGSRRSK